MGEGMQDVARGNSLPIYLTVEGASVVSTQKTVEDHVVSWVSGNDCSTVRASRGEKYCKEPPKPVPVVQRTAYCYKTIANVTCYSEPVPSDASQFLGTRTDDVPVAMP